MNKLNGIDSIKTVIILDFEGTIYNENKIIPDGFMEVIKQLAKNIRLFILTNGKRYIEIKKYEKFGFSDDDIRMYSAPSDFNLKKPDPEVLFKLFLAENISPKEALYIGDTDKDQLCAEGANIDYIGVSNSQDTLTILRNLLKVIKNER